MPKNIISKRNEEGDNLLLYGDEIIKAAKNGNASQVKYLMNKYPQLLGNKDEEGKTALMYAAENGDKDICDLLIKKEAGAQDNKGLSALMYASYKGHSKIVDKLIKNGKEIGLQDKQGRTALMYALSRGDVDHFKKEDWNKRKDFNKNSPVKGLYFRNNPSGGEGANPLYTDGTNFCVISLFKTKEIEPTYRDKNGATSFMWFCAINCPYLVNKLGKKIDQQIEKQGHEQDNYGKTAFDYGKEDFPWVEETISLEDKPGFLKKFPQYEQALANEKKQREQERLNSATHEVNLHMRQGNERDWEGLL